MAKVIAVIKGYFGGMIREQGDTFNVPDELWNDPKRRPSWASPAAFKGKGDHDDDGKTGGSKPAAPAGTDAVQTVVVPTDWHSGKAADRKALAELISGQKPANVKEADAIIEAYVDANKPAPFEEAPEPETAKPGNGVKEALGVDPDWLAPGADAPVAVAD